MCLPPDVCSIRRQKQTYFALYLQIYWTSVGIDPPYSIAASLQANQWTLVWFQAVYALILSLDEDWSSLYSLLSLINNLFLKSKEKRLAKWRMKMTFLQTIFKWFCNKLANWLRNLFKMNLKELQLSKFTFVRNHWFPKDKFSWTKSYPNPPKGIKGELK